jgi:hypothetical protein
MTIKTTGTGDDVRVLANTGEDEIQRVSCSCCDACASVPDEITVVFSGLTVCEPEYPAPITTATLTRFSISGWGYSGPFDEVTVTCTTSKDIHEFFPSRVEFIPEGIAADDTSTPLFAVNINGNAAPITNSNAFTGFYGVKDGPLANLLDSDGCGESDDNWAYGGTATISWE